MVKDILFEYPFYKKKNTKISIQQGENDYVFQYNQSLSSLSFFFSIVFGVSGGIFIFALLWDKIDTSRYYGSIVYLLAGILLITICVLFTFLLGWISYNISIFSGFPWESSKLLNSEIILLINQNTNSSIFSFMNSSYTFRFLDIYPFQKFVVQFHRGYGSIISRPKGLEFTFEYSKKDKLLNNIDFREKTLIVRDVNVNQVIYSLSKPKNSTTNAVIHQEIDKMTNLLLIALTGLMIINQWCEYPSD